MPHTESSNAAPSCAAPALVYRHRLPVRVMHWINVVALTVLFMSGLQIFNAHPALYWGKSSYTGEPAFLSIGVANPRATPDQWRGVVRIGTTEIDTTGVLGLSRHDGKIHPYAFPAWVTLPSSYNLALARDWHFLAAWVFVFNGLAYLLYSLASGHLRRDLLPDWRDWRGIGRSLRDHLLLRHARGAAALRYNVLQKLAYLTVIGVLLPLVVLMGMAMSPMLNAVLTGWVDWFGGRQSARSIHFIGAWLIVAFVLIHVAQVIIGGFWNHLRAMLTGYFRVVPEVPAAAVPGRQNEESKNA